MTLMTKLIRGIRASFVACLLAAVALSTPGDVRAQTPDSLPGPPVSVEALVAEVRAGDATGVGAFLRQTRGARTPAELEAVSDSLVAIMRTASTTRINVYSRVVGSIGDAITAEPEWGAPFPGGVDLLFRIYDSLDEPLLRSEVLFRLSLVAPRGDYFPCLQRRWKPLNPNPSPHFASWRRRWARLASPSSRTPTVRTGSTIPPANASADIFEVE
ncbi:MAG: hypothetical protein EA351_04125 [Gemmatimonadales bacterium]|nr:MAG: hypothetical protein EA351_04125 [Gemmatimonadales bacterium]